MQQKNELLTAQRISEASTDTGKRSSRVQWQSKTLHMTYHRQVAEVGNITSGWKKVETIKDSAEALIVA